jgi:hypothetical protein
MSERVRPAQSLRALLAGGDRRSLARSERARALIVGSPHRVAELAALANDGDWLVALRALDLLEKLAHDHPDWVAPHRELFIGPLADSDQWEMRLQVVRALPCFQWTGRARRRALRILRRDLEHPRLFVRAWALDSLARFADADRSLRPVVRRHLQAFARSGKPALMARARNIASRAAPP